MREANYVCPGCNGSGGVNEDRHDDIEGSVKLITTLRARVERAELAMRNAEAGVLSLTQTKRDLLEALDKSEARAERAEQDARFAVEALLLHNKDALPMATRMVEMEQALSAAQSTIADLKAEVGRLREDAARWKHWLNNHGWSGYFDDGATNSESDADIIAACDKARAALGE